MCVFNLTKGIRKACLRYSVWFPLRPSGEDRSLLETDSVCMNHSVGVCMCVILCVYMYQTLFVLARLPCCPSYPYSTHFPYFLIFIFFQTTILQTSSVSFQLKTSVSFTFTIKMLLVAFTSVGLSHIESCSNIPHNAHLQPLNSVI